MSTIFISHSSLDHEISREIKRRLAEQNHPSVFLDLDPDKGIVAGQSWEQTLYRKLRACRAVVALCTDNYLASQWCFAEIALARMEGKHILALQANPLARDAKMPAILTERQFIDLREDPEEGYRRLWRGLQEMDLLGVASDWDHKNPPYLGLSAYQEEHAPVFFGRDDEIRGGLELLDRGAPGLIMVLGASGSGKSSMVRAGMVPRLRLEADRWLIVGPFRPRRDPFAELAETLVNAFQRYAPDEVRSGETRERLRALRALGAGPQASSEPGVEDERADGETSFPRDGDKRLALLLRQLEELRRSPPEGGGSPLLEFLDWSLDDLRRICGEPGEAQPVAKRGERRDVDSSTLVEIADHLRRTSGRQDARVLFVIDQFEELLGYDNARDDANKFLELVRHAFETEHTPVMVLGTMRSDFLGVFQRNRALLGVDFESLSVGPMHVDGMRRVIEEPARLGAIELEQGLADRLLADTETPDALPLLSFTMSVLWKGRQNGKVSVRQYEELDGLHGAVAREAEVVLSMARRQGNEEEVREAFLQMARLTEDGTYARRPVSWEQEEIRKVRPTLEEFESRRLLVTRMEKGEERTVEVAHEALFRSWAPLKSWLDDHRAVLMLRAQLRRDARAWVESDRASDNLWHGGRLQQAEDVIGKGELHGSEKDGSEEMEFVRAGVRRRRRQHGALAGITILVFAVLAGFLWYAMSKKRDAGRQRDAAWQLQSLFLANAASQQLSTGDAVSGALLALEGLQDPESQDPRQRIRPYVPEANVGLESAWRGQRERIVLAGHTDWVLTTSFSPDRSRLVSASQDKTARVWDVKTAKLIRVLRGHGARVANAVFSPDGKRIATASYDKTARLWDAETGILILSLEGHTDRVTRAVFSPDGSRIATSSADQTARLWDAATGDSIRALEGHRDRVTSIVFSSDGDHLVTASWDKTARLWDASTGSLIRKITGHADSLYEAAFSPNGAFIATASRDKTARLWRSANGELVRVLEGHDNYVWSVSFSPDGSRIATASQDATVRLWDAATGSLVETFTGHQRPVNDAVFSSDGEFIATSADDKTARIWSAVGSQVVATLSGHEGTVYGSAFSPDGSLVATGSEDMKARVWDAATGEVIQTLSGHVNWVQSAAFSPDASRVVTGSKDGTARVWDVATGKVIHDLQGHGDKVTSAVFDRAGDRIATASNDTTTRLWDAATGRTIQILTGHQGLVNSIEFSADGERILTASQDRTARLWDTETGQMIRTFEGHEDPVHQAAFSPNGTRIVTASQDNTARLWDTETGQPILTFTGHSDTLWGAAFSPDGNHVVTASQDKTGRVWSVSTGEVKKVLQGHAGEIHSVAFSPDGTRIVTGSADGTSRVWDAVIPDTQELIDRVKKEVPRCLTPEQRTQFFLAPEPPRFCIELGKWPYHTEEGQ